MSEIKFPTFTLPNVRAYGSAVQAKQAEPGSGAPSYESRVDISYLPAGPPKLTVKTPVPVEVPAKAAEPQAQAPRDTSIQATGQNGEKVSSASLNGPLLMEAPAPTPSPISASKTPPPATSQKSRFMSGLKKVALYGGAAALLGAGMATGGIGGMVCGALVGTLVGSTTLGSVRAAGGGISAGNILGPLLGLAGGAALGLCGLPNGGLIMGGLMTAIQSYRSHHNIAM